MQKTCPVCAAPGQDLVFKFECTNPDCQNFVLEPRMNDRQQCEDDKPEPDDDSLDWVLWTD